MWPCLGGSRELSGLHPAEMNHEGARGGVTQVLQPGRRAGPDKIRRTLPLTDLRNRIIRSGQHLGSSHSAAVTCSMSPVVVVGCEGANGEGQHVDVPYRAARLRSAMRTASVSYTHLTLPTNREV